MNLNRIEALKPFMPTEPPARAFAPLSGAFADMVERIKNGEDAVKHLALGDGGSLHATMIAMEKAKLSMEVLAGVRNRLMSAWQELMREQI